MREQLLSGDRVVPMLNRIVSPADSKDLEAQRGLSVMELVIVIMVFALLLMPALSLMSSDIEAKRIQRTQDALETARDALVAFAAANNGCLPFAADFEGGLPDTDQTGAASSSYFDNGTHSSGKHAGDLPWGTLGFTDSFLDGENLRLQYVVAKPYTDSDGSLLNGISCDAGYRGREWDPSVTYQGTNPNPLYVYYAVGTDRRLYEVTGTLPAGTPPNTAGPTVAQDVTAPLPDPLLQVRRGPDVLGTGGQADVLSAQNVFVLIAPGENRNAGLGRPYVRDSNHVLDDAGNPWALDVPTVNTVIFSNTPNVDSNDPNNDGDDTLLVMSFINFKAEIRKFGLSMESVCDGSC